LPLPSVSEPFLAWTTSGVKSIFRSGKINGLGSLTVSGKALSFSRLEVLPTMFAGKQ